MNERQNLKTAQVLARIILQHRVWNCVELNSLDVPKLVLLKWSFGNNYLLKILKLLYWVRRKYKLELLTFKFSFSAYPLGLQPFLTTIHKCVNISWSQYMKPRLCLSALSVQCSSACSCSSSQCHIAMCVCLSVKHKVLNYQSFKHLVQSVIASHR